MSRDNDQKHGGQAFPRAGAEGDTWLGLPTDGMTLRDYYAGEAMKAIIAKHGVYDEESQVETQSEATRFGYDSQVVSNIAFDYAEAMLEVRNERQ